MQRQVSLSVPGGIPDMAIVFNCPHCQFDYRLPDKLAGKQAKCKNPECRKLITIPAPITVPDDAPQLDTAALEAAALNALSDEAPKEGEVPLEEKVIPMTCKYCDHKWTEPWAKAGKNTLCPNPECRQRQKVPEPTDDTPQDWRQQKTKLPEGAKGARPKLDDVVDAEDVKYIGGETVVKAGLLDQELEPRSFREKFIIFCLIVLPISLIGFGGCYWRSSSIEKTKHQFMEDARRDLDKAAPELAPAEVGPMSAVLNIAAAEYALRHNTAEQLKEAQKHFNAALSDLRKQLSEAEYKAVGLERQAIAVELSLIVLEFAGTDEQVKEQLRYRWRPDESGRVVRMNEKSHTIHEELGKTLSLLSGADFEFRLMAARRVTQSLAKRGQAAMAADLLPLALFGDAERPEAQAVIALEIWRADKSSDLPKKTADELKGAFGKEIKGNPYPASAQTLFTILAVEKAPQVTPTPPGGAGTISSDATVLAHTGILLLRGETDAAIALAKRGRPEIQLKALALAAEWAADPATALDASAATVIASKSLKTQLPAPNLLRLSQLAAAANRHDHAKTFADAITDEGLKMWARGDAARHRIASSPKDKADETWVEVPEDAKKIRAGHTWGRLWIARQNTKLSGNRDAEKKATGSWPNPVRPFGLAGIALGLQDRDR